MDEPETLDGLCNLRQAMRRTGLCHETLRQRTFSGEVQVVRSGGLVYFTVESLDRLNITPRPLGPRRRENVA